MTDEPPYLCWEAHREDLTAQVQAEQAAPGELTLFYRRREGQQQPSKVFVTCSAGHLNVFEPAAAGGQG
jgi:hypothetical protein